MEKTKKTIEPKYYGFDSQRIDFKDIYKRKLYFTETVYGADAATAANFKTFLIVPEAGVLTGFREVHAIAGTDGGAVTLDLEKLTGTTEPGSGVSMLGATLSLKATKDTVQVATFTTTLANRSVVAGDRIALKTSGTLTGLVDVTVLVEITVK